MRLAGGLRARGSVAGAHVTGLSGRLTVALQGMRRRAPAEAASRRVALDRATSGYLVGTRARIEHLAALHELLSPARTVSRGYAIVWTGDGKRVRTDAAGVCAGDELSLELRDGRIQVEVSG